MLFHLSSSITRPVDFPSFPPTCFKIFKTLLWLEISPFFHVFSSNSAHVHCC
jgi:hypothetical protein